MTVRDNSEKMLTGIRAAEKDGLIAKANVYRNAVVRGLRGGYTSGNFVTGLNTASVSISPYVAGSGDSKYIMVGTNVLYALFWEIGHHNIFTRRFERVEVWRPAIEESADRMIQAYMSAFQRTMKRSLA